MVDLPLYLSLDDVLLLPNPSSISSRSEINPSWTLNHLQFSLPIISINMDCVTGVDMAIALGRLGGFSILPRFDLPEVQAEKVKEIKLSEVPVAAAIGIKEGELKRLDLLVAAGADHISIDVAHGHLSRVIDMVKIIRQKYPQLSLSAGVVGTPEAATDLFTAGVDAVRVGVGPGTICTTRLQTGCGVPQFTAISECATVARKMGKIILADGGTKNSGDMVKALAAGASAVITGYQLAGTTETPPPIVKINGRQFKEYNASTSLKEKQKQFAVNSDDKTANYLKHVEGIEGFVPYRGPVADVVASLMAGIHSGYSYCGAKTTSEIWQKARFIRVTSLGVRENASRSVVLQSP